MGSSRVVSGALGPEWNESFEFDLTPAEFSVRLSLYDGKAVEGRAGGGGGGFGRLGVAEVPIKEIMFRGGCEKWFDLRSDPHRVVSSGRVLVKVAFRDSRVRPTLVLQSESEQPLEPASSQLLQAAGRREGRERAVAPASADGINADTGGKLTVTVVRAEGLLAKDRGGTSDPFAELYLGKQFKKTKVIDKTLNPVWNETFELEVGPDDSDLSVVLYDNDKGIIFGSSKEFLGSIKLPIKDIVKRGSVEKWFDLQYDSQYQKKVETMTGSVLLRLSFQSTSWPRPDASPALPSGISVPSTEAIALKSMKVTMVRAEGLLAKDKGGTSDPFVELFLGQQFKKTKIIDKTLNPVWNETFDFDLSKGDQTLSVVLYDNDKGMLYGSTKEYLGSIELPVKELVKRGALEKWFDLEYNAKYQNFFETITGRVLIRFSFGDTDSNQIAGPRSPHSNAEQERNAVPLEKTVSFTAKRANQKMFVSVLKAENLLAKDRGGTSDPFAELIMGKQFKHTRIIDKTLNPVWNENFEFDVGSEEENLSVVLYDNDKGVLYGNSKEYLGSIKLSLNEISIGAEQWYDLQFDGQYQKKVEVITGRVLLKISFQDTSSALSPAEVPKLEQNSTAVNSIAKSKKILVTVKKAENLLAKDRGGTSDPFAVLILGRQIKKTSIIDKTLNPEWNETFELELTSSDSNMNVVLYDYDKGIFFGGSQEYLGSVIVPIRTMLDRRSVEEWFTLQFDVQYQKHVEVVTGRVLIRVEEPAPPPPPPSEAPPPLLLVTLVRAEGLRADGNGATFSPYAELTFGNQVKNSSLKDDSINPVWNEDFRFNVTDKQLKLDVVLSGCALAGKDNFGNTAEFGAIQISIADMIFGKLQESWYPLKARDQTVSGKILGRVLIKMVMQP